MVHWEIFRVLKWGFLGLRNGAVNFFLGGNFRGHEVYLGFKIHSSPRYTLINDRALTTVMLRNGSNKNKCGDGGLIALKHNTKKHEMIFQTLIHILGTFILVFFIKRALLELSHHMHFLNKCVAGRCQLFKAYLAIVM